MSHTPEQQGAGEVKDDQKYYEDLADHYVMSEPCDYGYHKHDVAKDIKRAFLAGVSLSFESAKDYAIQYADAVIHIAQLTRDLEQARKERDELKDQRHAAFDYLSKEWTGCNHTKLLNLIKPAAISNNKPQQP